ncbi:MAG: hypothetical protein WD534_01245 [Phycisphaeraceae bacterium]
MPLDPDHPAERFFAALPGWLFLIGALTLLALMLLTPAWLHGREMAWKQQFMQAQLEHLEAQQQRYQQFHAALQSHDPVLLERLAFTHLRLKPADKQLLDPAGSTAMVATPSGPAGSATPGDRLPSAAVEAWLAEPMPVVGEDVPAPHRLETRLTRLVQGRSRLGIIVAAMLCLLGSLWYGPGEVNRRKAPADGRR